MSDFHITPLNLKIPKITIGEPMKDARSTTERISEIRRMMEMVAELETVRKKYGKGLTGSDTVNASLPLEDLEIKVYGSFANMVEKRLKYLEAEPE